MNYLYGWLGAGALTLVVVLGAHLMSAERKSESIQDILEAINPERRKLSYRVLNDVVAPALAGILIVIAWPIALFVKVKEWVRPDDKDKRRDQTEKQFSVDSSHLKERLSVQEIERREMVIDPLHAAPALPFGHLHNTWCTLIEGLTSESELWSFSAIWECGWGARELREGYVVVRNGVPGAFLMTVWTQLENKK